MDETYNCCEEFDNSTNDMEIEGTIDSSEEDVVIIDDDSDTKPIDTPSIVPIEPDPLAPSMDKFEELQKKAQEVEREESGDVDEAKNGRLLCATRHGCQGATDCNYAYGDYPG